ncbi:Alcohol dehydrogenase GroES domain protein [Thermosinus carboxydivorans Nor1]|uniref:Alcohol dehydrogenase GroES domain protein n=1 Tax=Thermosinus carboxydivorans Nor1 TaxID=401526 RepID=A1HSQ8_9FIRM|nr:alcohol dehydrogenase catalytic domain-containing protein [Thermosinus carboxydivorans]EAX46939.1 Alcohol dehydrogenase GroES domain protein [Thermosinus carboxydivorans Nor1]
MKVIEVLKPGQLTVGERPMPAAPVGGEVVVKIKAAGICGSDVHIFHGQNPFATYPRILGHEAVGEVYQAGAEVKDLKPGDRVAIDNVFSCGRCYACRSNRHNVCREVKVLGVHIDGVFQEYIKITADKLYKLPADLPWEMAATVEPYSIAAEAVDRAGVTKDDTVLVCGAGPIGLVILQASKRLGARVAVMDIVASRLERAKAMGADLTINTRETDLLEAVREFAGGEGVNIVMEATGNIGVLELAVAKLVSQAGKVIVLGFPVEPAKIVPADIMRRELDIKGSRLNNKKFPEVIRWLAGKEVDPTGLVTHVLPFTDAAKAMELFANNPEEVCKIILRFD